MLGLVWTPLEQNGSEECAVLAGAVWRLWFDGLLKINRHRLIHAISLASSDCLLYQVASGSRVQARTSHVFSEIGASSSCGEKLLPWCVSFQRQRRIIIMPATERSRLLDHGAGEDGDSEQHDGKKVKSMNKAGLSRFRFVILVRVFTRLIWIPLHRRSSTELSCSVFSPRLSLWRWMGL